MTKLTVKMYTVLKEKTGASTVEINAKTVAEALDKLKEKFGKKFILGESYVFLLNDEIIERKDFKKIKIKKGDFLHIFPPIAGGFPMSIGTPPRQ